MMESFSSVTQQLVNFEYLYYLPEGYEEDPQRQWPLLLFLHGAGERGSDVNTLKNNGIPYEITKGRKLPFVVVCPQCPNNDWWILELKNLNVFLDGMIDRYRIDEKRIYLAGISMGGYGTWHMAMAYPEKFAAIVPICGGGMCWNAERLKNVPVWAFHGEKDPLVPVSESIHMVEAVNRCGGNVKLTLYPELEHDSWSVTFANDEVYLWMEKQKKNP